MAIFSKPQYSTVKVRTREGIKKGIWTKCPSSGEMVYVKDLKKNLMVVPSSGYHFPLPARERVESLVDKGTFVEFDQGLSSLDPLKFKGVASYKEKLEDNKKKTGMADAVLCGIGKMGGREVSLAVMDFRFLGGSMGSVVGEKITRAIERALEGDMPILIVSASGGARMNEGIISLRTSGTGRLCWPTRHQGHDPSRFARRFPDVRVSSRAWPHRPDCSTFGVARTH